jgi:hypothetical protein
MPVQSLLAAHVCGRSSEFSIVHFLCKHLPCRHAGGTLLYSGYCGGTSLSNSAFHACRPVCLARPALMDAGSRAHSVGVPYTGTMLLQLALSSIF